MFSITEVLDMAIKLENNGEAVYRGAVAKVSKPELVSLLEWMADEEVKHANWFSELKMSVETKNVNPFLEEMSRELFNDLLGNEGFSLKEVDFSSIDHVSDLVAVFIEFEKDTVLFYQMLRPFIEDPVTLENLDQIIDEENRHIKQLQEFAENKEPFTTIGD